MTPPPRCFHGFLWFQVSFWGVFKVPGQFFRLGFHGSRSVLRFLRFQVGFSWSWWVSMVIHGSRSFFLVPGWFWRSLIMTIMIIFTTMMVLSQESSMSHFLRRQIEPREETQPYHPNLPSSKNYFPTLIEVKFPFVCAKIVLYILLNGCWSVKFSGKCWSFFPICAQKLFLRTLRNSRCSSSCNSLRGITHSYICVLN